MRSAVLRRNHRRRQGRASRGTALRQHFGDGGAVFRNPEVDRDSMAPDTIPAAFAGKVRGGRI